jgi:hypothetical protein
MRAYAPTTGKNIFKTSKNSEKKLKHISRYSMCMCQVWRKTDIFYVWCKKTKKNVSFNAYFSTKFYLSYIQHEKISFFMKQLLRRLNVQIYV